MKANKNSVRRSLIVSATALVLTVAMLIGTTFAWFTDSVTSGRNKIQAGNLDVELDYKNSKTSGFETVTDETKIFSDSEDGVLWEPGHVEYAVLKVKNAGTLALKYSLGVNVVSEKESTSVETNPIKLSEHLKVAVIDDDATEGLNEDEAIARSELIGKAENASPKWLSDAGYAAENQELYPASAGVDKSSEKVVTMVIWMPTDVGNEANYVKTAEPPTIDMGINLVATQYTYEEDSFGPDYDEGATYRVVDAKDIADSINNAKPGDTLKVEGTVTADDVTNGKLTIDKENITVENLTSEVPVSITADDVALKNAAVTTQVEKTPALAVDKGVTAVTITDSTFSANTGDLGTHTAVSIPIAGKVVFTGNTVKNNYNGIEFGLNQSLATGSIISNNNFEGIPHNAISIYQTEENANITIQNNVFTSVEDGNFIRLSNVTSVVATYNILNNNIDTENSWKKSIVLLEDHTGKQDENHTGKQDFEKITLNFKDNILNTSDESKVKYALVYEDCTRSILVDTNQPKVIK